jgi:2-succinyl-5-enolpyruvyl-6-hydroxy-3-cyclohexene-1-carboxylate synthase
VDPTNRNTALASAMVEELARCGMRRAVVCPGSRSTPLALALWREPAIAVEVILDERSAGFTALGHALGDGRPAVVLCTSGSAAANLHPSVVEADEASVPLVVLTADRPPELRDIGAGQTIDQVKLYGSSARWFCELGTHEADDEGLLHFRSVACRAYAAAAGDPRPGPVHLNVPWRDPLGPEPVAGDVTATDTLALEGRSTAPLSVVSRSARRPNEGEIDRLAERIEGSPRGLIVAGRQSDRRLGDAVAALAAAAGYPVVAEPTSQLRRGAHDRSLVLSSYDFISRDRPEELEPELVIRFGELPTSKPLRQWLASIEGLDQIVVDADAEWREPTRRAATLVRADATPLARALADRIARRREGASAAAGSPFATAWLDADAAVSGTVDERIGGLDELSEPGAWRAIGDALRDGDTLLAASSMPVRDLEAFLRPGAEGVRFLSNRGANGIDGLVSTAAGAAIASGGRTWAVLGDLALLHDVGGLAVARRAPELRFVVLDNGGGGIFHFLPQAAQLEDEEFEALLGTPPAIAPAAALRTFGFEVAEPETPPELAAALESDARAIVVHVNRARNRELHRELAEAAAATIA